MKKPILQEELSVEDNIMAILQLRTNLTDEMRAEALENLLQEVPCIQYISCFDRSKKNMKV